MKMTIMIFGVIAFTLFSCKNGEENKVNNGATTIKNMPVWKEPKTISYTLESSKEWLKANKSEKELAIALAVNRTDKENFTRLDSVIIPTDLSGDLVFYFPFPLQVDSLREIDKIILFSYATQTFAAYENGVLIHVGPTNMGREKDQTPVGLFFTNWKAEHTTSTFNDEWELKWNFNIENKKGIGFHQYNLPGYPASHSCLRLLEKDAEFLYTWADQWVLEDDQNIKFKGTPVVVFGSYNFKGSKPWLQLVEDPEALNISESEIEKVIAPYLDTILKEQNKKKNKV